ncbi:cation:proton antiporter [Lichenibacterium dinghuense]|uniref:cation:proton antiporter n=1 Tax=Lichenibacterium dinghuense TaxID=2895977 RepID=UPI001F2AE7A0|nr:sodium:proton antiporter [Lichenibacterium sp. 6Y81]
MSILDLSAILLTLSAVFGWLNRKVDLLPHAIGLLLMGVAASLVLVAVDAVVPGHRASGALGRVLHQIDFSAVVMDGMLAFLIFAGALHVDVGKLRSHAVPVVVLAIVGTAISTAIVGCGFWVIARQLDHPLPLVWALVFGALISPTDPVAVMSTLKTVSIPAKLEVQLQGESLFNDGVSIVIFTVLLRYATGAPAAETTPTAIAELLLLEAGGGLLLGTAAGYVAYRAMRAIDDYPVEVLITLALVTATYAVAEAIHVSGPLAMVAAGLLIGDRGLRLAMSDTTKRYVLALWTLIDEVLNSVLFLLIGLEVLLVAFDRGDVALALLAVPLVIAARGLALAVPVAVFARSGHFSARNMPFLTWAGVRGGISVALALAVPDGPSKSIILVATYAVVLFSIAVQGSTLGWLARRTVGT